MLSKRADQRRKEQMPRDSVVATADLPTSDVKPQQLVFRVVNQLGQEGASKLTSICSPKARNTLLSGDFRSSPRLFSRDSESR